MQGVVYQQLSFLSYLSPLPLPNKTVNQPKCIQKHGTKLCLVWSSAGRKWKITFISPPSRGNKLGIWGLPVEPPTRNDFVHISLLDLVTENLFDGLESYTDEILARFLKASMGQGSVDVDFLEGTLRWRSEWRKEGRNVYTAWSTHERRLSREVK
jgi:hypothetical protein